MFFSRYFGFLLITRPKIKLRRRATHRSTRRDERYNFAHVGIFRLPTRFDETALFAIFGCSPITSPAMQLAGRSTLRSTRRDELYNFSSTEKFRPPTRFDGTALFLLKLVRVCDTSPPNEALGL